MTTNERFRRFGFTPEDVLRAYKVTGLKPARGITRCGDNACPIGALDAERFGAEAHSLVMDAVEDLGLDVKCAGDFIHAWDGTAYPDAGARDLVRETVRLLQMAGLMT